MAVNAAWAERHRDALGGGTVDCYADGDSLATALAAEWTTDLVIVDLTLVTPALARRLGHGAPRLLAFGDPAYAGVVLAAEFGDFIPDEPTPDELAAAVDAVLTRGGPGEVAELSDRSLSRLGALGAEAARVADALARLGSASTAPPPDLDVHLLKSIIRARRERGRFFPPGIFGEPAWDMLLDLACAKFDRREVAVSSLCIAAAVPTTTALRWIRNLCDAGLFERHDDPLDARRAFISLSPATATAMARCLAAAP